VHSRHIKPKYVMSLRCPYPRHSKNSTALG